MSTPQRSAAEIRDSMEANRAEFAVSVQRLRGEVERITDWRGQLERHRGELMVGAAAVVGLFVAKRVLRRRRRRGE
jgi:hypothetical protein